MEERFKKIEQLKEKQKLIDKETQKKNIIIEKFDKICDLSSQFFGLTFLGGVGLGALGAFLMPICPMATPFLFYGCEALGSVGLLGGLGSSSIGLLIKVIKK